jgi:hypothetical protein
MAVDAGLRQIIRERLPQFDIVTIELGAVGAGAPDVNYCHAGIEGWIECKRADHWRATIRPVQVGWAERRLDFGGRVYVAVRRTEDELWLLQGCMIRRLCSERLDEVPWPGAWSGGPARRDWKEVARILTEPSILL